MKKRKNNNGILNYVVISLVAVLAIGSVALAYAVTQNINVDGDYNYYESDEQPIPEEILGGQPSPDHYIHNRFLGNYSVGGGGYYATSSTASAYTLTTKEIPNNRELAYIEWNAGLNLALTTMASTSAPLSSLKVGESFSFQFYSATTTAATTITWTAGTGIDLVEPEINGTVIQNGGDHARITFTKKANTDVLCITEIFQVGD